MEPITNRISNFKIDIQVHFHYVASVSTQGFYIYQGVLMNTFVAHSS